ncbi:hypothetical protein ACUTQ5_19345 [Serratia sp. NA_112.1]|uniref:hypothetical protein n=1 Tax=Serratia sp. NA_112.1 TaxID=3415665 RepID=UPI004046FBCE
MKVMLVSLGLAFILGSVSGYGFKTWQTQPFSQENISFNAAIKKALPSVVYLYAGECEKGRYGCPLGAGVIMDPDGHILSNGDRVSTRYVAHDSMTDLALLTFDTAGKK